MSRMRVMLTLCGLAVALRPATPALALSNHELLEILATNTPLVQSPRFERLAIENLIKAADPRAMLTTPAAASAQTNGTTLGKIEIWPEGIGYIKLDGLYDSGTLALSGAISTLSTGAPSGLLLDLRDAGGAGLGAADALLGMLVSSTSTLYTVQDRTGTVVSERPAAAPSPAPTRPVMILANQQTREAPELVCALAKGAPRTLLIGTPTAGDMNLRSILPVSETQALYVTTHRLVPRTPAPPASDQGIIPHIVLTNIQSTLYGAAPETETPGRRQPSAKAHQDIELANKVMSDPELARTADILLGLRALAQVYVEPATPARQRSTGTNTVPLAERPEMPLE